MEAIKVTVEINVNVPVEKAWSFWTNAEDIKMWNAASPDWHTTKAENNLTIGGKFSYRMEAKDGSFGFDFGGVYDAVTSNEYIKYTMDDSRICQITFTNKGDSTHISSTFEAESENPVEMQKAGWQSIMDNYKSYVETKQTIKIFMTGNNITTIKPFLTVHNAKKAVDFYVSAFGAIETKRFEISDKKTSSVIQIEKAEFYVGDEEPENGSLSPDLKSNSSVRIILQTKNAEKLFEKAIRFGATEICPMTTEEDWRIGKLKDPFGHIWEIGYTL